ncbi:hypothetical protein LTR37_003858 [Vermiconidia calcicola]|uniref:Uncharacterized protein n=1 Tax=Vermiconidia calcicola TaxID=1690605 RepID=A0ACC3NPC3_9PEZI|nr:hypothetical protein LTR37_003858 [Vermiconidia calcicola]
MERKGITVCHECMLLLRQPKRTRQWRTAAPAIRQWTGRSFTTANAPFELSKRRAGIRGQREKPQQTGGANLHTQRRYNAHTSSQDLEALHARIDELSSSALKPEDQKLPSEQRVLYVLEQLDAIAHGLVDTGKATETNRQKGTPRQKDTTATSALLGSVNARQYPAFLTKASLLNLISEKAEEMLRHTNIFITPAVLKSYIDLQTLLQQPSSFPDIFTLYATKPIPSLSSDGLVIYNQVSSHKINSAVPSDTANTALTAAITTHNLPLSIDIITSTFCTPAFKKNKSLRQALLPSTILTLAPVAAYTLSQQFALIQTTMSPGYATGIAFAGFMTYISTIAGLGYVVITTANDQMDRVTWAKGVPLWERWVREEERAALDRVAGKWGFEGLERRGEEEGEEWEGLREFVGLRGMVLDRVELMEGME